MQRRLPGFLLTVGSLAGAMAALGQQPPASPTFKPYRVLVVVETWGDPASQVITEKDTFQPVAALLKAWACSREKTAVERLKPTHFLSCPG